MPCHDFDWTHEDATIFIYQAWWQHKPLFQVGYLKTPGGLQTSERQILPLGKFNSRMWGITRPLFRVAQVHDRNAIVFAENELAAEAFNRKRGEFGLESVMIATTTSGEPVHADETDFALERDIIR